MFLCIDSEGTSIIHRNGNIYNGRVLDADVMIFRRGCNINPFAYNQCAIRVLIFAEICHQNQDKNPYERYNVRR